VPIVKLFIGFYSFHFVVDPQHTVDKLASCLDSQQWPVIA